MHLGKAKVKRLIMWPVKIGLREGIKTLLIISEERENTLDYYILEKKNTIFLLVQSDQTLPFLLAMDDDMELKRGIRINKLG